MHNCNIIACLGERNYFLGRDRSKGKILKFVLGEKILQARRFSTGFVFGADCAPEAKLASATRLKRESPPLFCPAGTTLDGDGCTNQPCNQLLLKEKIEATPGKLAELPNPPRPQITAVSPRAARLLSSTCKLHAKISGAPAAIRESPRSKARCQMPGTHCGWTPH